MKQLKEAFTKAGFKSAKKGKRKSPSILAKYTRIPVTNLVDEINIRTRGGSLKDLTGKEYMEIALSPRARREFRVISHFSSVANFMALANSNLISPRPELGTKHPSEIRKALKGSRTRHVPNYWALVALAVAKSVQEDDKLIAYMYSSEGPFTSYTVEEAEELGEKFTLRIPTNIPPRYIGLLTELRSLIQKYDGVLSDDAVAEFVEACKDEPDVDLFDGVTFFGEISTKNDEEHEQEATEKTSPETKNIDPFFLENGFGKDSEQDAA